MNGKLYLIPTVLAEGSEDAVLPPVIKSTIQSLTHFLCENERTARRFVARLRVHPTVETLHLERLDKDTSPGALPELFRPLFDGHDMGLLSESGCPGIADPGALAVAFAHGHEIRVIPLTGPSSLLLALMASGLNGQQFAFHGYLPVDAQKFALAVQRLERESHEKNQTQLFIETPYRNNKMLGNLLKRLRGDTRLCIAANLTGPGEFIHCKTVQQWNSAVPTLDKVPATFLFLAVGK